MIDYSKIDWSKCKLPNVAGRVARVEFDNSAGELGITVTPLAQFSTSVSFAYMATSTNEWFIRTHRELEVRETLACIDITKAFIRENSVKRISGREALAMLVKAHPKPVKMRQAGKQEWVDYEFSPSHLPWPCVSVRRSGELLERIILMAFIDVDYEIPLEPPEAK